MTSTTSDKITTLMTHQRNVRLKNAHLKSIIIVSAELINAKLENTARTAAICNKHKQMGSELTKILTPPEKALI